MEVRRALMHAAHRENPFKSRGSDFRSDGLLILRRNLSGKPGNSRKGN